MIDSNLMCRCGCGQPLGNISRATAYRIRRGDNAGWLKGHRFKAFRNPRWKGGKTASSGGYTLIKAPAHPNARASGYILEHRLVMAQQFDRPLSANEIVHHVDHSKQNNSPNNLQITDRPDHARMHATGADNPRWTGWSLQEKLCLGCGNGFVKGWSGNQRRDQFCSRECMKAHMIGENAANVRLTDDQVAEIRRLYSAGCSQRSLAAQFGCSKTQVGRIVRHESR